MPASADSKNKRVANSSPVTHQTLLHQGGSGEDGHIDLADWTLSVATSAHPNLSLAVEWLKCCFTSTETVGLLGTGAQHGHLDFHTAHELLFGSSLGSSFKLWLADAAVPALLQVSHAVNDVFNDDGQQVRVPLNSQTHARAPIPQPLPLCKKVSEGNRCIINGPFRRSKQDPGCALPPKR